MLGLVWTEDDIKALASGLTDGAGPKSLKELEAGSTEQKAGPLRFPLSLLIRPELIEQLKEKVIPSQGGKHGMPHVPASATSLSDVTKEDFLRKLGATPVQDRNLSPGDDMFGQSQRSEGFREGPMRTIGGKRR